MMVMYSSFFWLMLLLFGGYSSWALKMPCRHPASRSNLFRTSATISDDDIVASTSRESATSTSASLNDFSKFDYTNHWYPVSWKRDLPLNKPVKVTVFDVDYVVARISRNEVIAMVDRCPHKSAALSEGRITSSGLVQCAYHGWSFDGTDGTCLEIPQIVQPDGAMGTASLSQRASGIAVPAMILQDMVYLFPGGNLEKSLAAPMPPTIPDVEQQEGWKCSQVVRDFPIDWAILLENILDPDHGLFAHGTVGFDLYSATKDTPQALVEESTDGGKGWKATASVDATFKLLDLNKRLTGKQVKKDDASAAAEKTGFLTFHAPCFAYYCRRDKKTNETTFMTSFYITPTGTGKSRFMSGALYKAPFTVPRWLVTAQQMNFLDQDTYLLATQQQHVLQFEADAVKHVVNPATYNSRVRRNHYNYRSPAEKLAVRVGALWDATLTRAPNRLEALQSMKQVVDVAPRSVVLDRQVQHLSICPDSQDAVSNCERLQFISNAMIWSVMGAKAWVTLVARGLWAIQVDSVLSPRLLALTLGLAYATKTLAGKLKAEYFFKYTNKYHEKDLANIPKVWRDTMVSNV